jgi:SAM-dependent methyltransferase
MELDEAYWSNRYKNNTAAWDTGTITPPLKEYFEQLTNKDSSILIPGCGNSYEAGYLLEKGFTNITLIDISTTLCTNLEQKFEKYLSAQLRVICTDFFDHSGAYDLVIEQTFFCALAPGWRNKYVQCIHRLLKPGGKLVGLFFNRAFEGGPPFGGNEAEYRQLFQQFFEKIEMESCYNSIEPRKNAELFVKLVK